MMAVWLQEEKGGKSGVLYDAGNWRSGECDTRTGSTEVSRGHTTLLDPTSYSVYIYVGILRIWAMSALI